MQEFDNIKDMIYCEIEDLQTKYEELLNSEWTVSFPVNLIQAEQDSADLTPSSGYGISSRNWMIKKKLKQKQRS